MSVSLVGLIGCAQVEPSQEKPALDTLANTTYPADEGPLLPADEVNWATAAQTAGGTDARSDFLRAQSLMSSLAVAAYEEQAGFDQRMKPLGLFGSRLASVEGFFHSARPEAYVGTSKLQKLTFVAIRGTSAFADYLTDFYNAPILTDGSVKGTVHRGFAQYAEGVYGQVKSRLALSCSPRLTPEQKLPLWITGHSLGAAAAAIVAYRLQQDGCNVAGVSLFAPPRPGLADFRDNYNGLLPDITQRWTTDRDPIYCLPPGGAWKHVGSENKISGGLHVGTGNSEQQCSSPKEVIGAIKTSLIALGPLAVGEAYVTQALLDWLANKFDLGIVCPNDTKWDTLWSLGLCAVKDYGYGVTSIYNLSPQDILTSAISLAMLRYHNPNRYLIDADFTNPTTEWTTVRVLIGRGNLPNGGGFAPTISEEIYQGVCQPEVLDSQYFFCDFRAPVGYRLRLTSDAVLASYDLDSQCDVFLSDANSPLACEMTVRGATTLRVFRNDPI